MFFVYSFIVVCSAVVFGLVLYFFVGLCCCFCVCVVGFFPFLSSSGVAALAASRIFKSFEQMWWNLAESKRH